MTNHAVLMNEIETLPASCINEVIDFVTWIKKRNQDSSSLLQIPETMLLSEAILAKDWNTPEEDEAWSTL